MLRTITQNYIDQDNSDMRLVSLLLQTFQAQTRIDHGMRAPAGVLICAKVNCAMPLYLPFVAFGQTPFWFERNVRINRAWGLPLRETCLGDRYPFRADMHGFVAKGTAGEKGRKEPGYLSSR